MTTSQVDTRPHCWDDARDTSFFRLTASLFSPDFCLGATVLLASYDDETEAATEVPSAAPSAPGLSSGARAVLHTS